MTDNEIIKALELCNSSFLDRSCRECQFYKVSHCSTALINEGINLINRQKAEIERLTAEANRYERYYFNHEYDKIKSEARKEFAERAETQLSPTFSALFRISETLVDVSKSHISSDIAIDKIREELQQNDIVCSRFKYSQMLDNLLEKMEERE